MSFGGSGSGGTIRYALMFDSTQAVQSVKTFQSNLAQLGAGLFVGGNKSNSNSNSNSGGGDTIIENHIHIGDENLLRKFTARSGRNRFTMGA